MAHTVSQPAAFARALERITLFLALLGFFAVGVSGEVGPITLIGGTLAMGLSPLRRRLPWVPSERIWNWLTAFVLGFCLCYWQLVTHDLLPPIILFTTYLQVLRLFSPRSSRDLLQVFVIAFAMLLLASVLTTSPLFLPICLAFAFCMLVGLILLTMRREAERTGLYPVNVTIPPATPLDALIHRRFFYSLVGTCLSLLFIASVFFVTLPRYQGQDWFRGLRRSRGGGESTSEVSSGMGNSVALGQISQIRLDPTIVMRVWPIRRSPTGDPRAGRDHLRLRGQALGIFNGQRWDPTGRDTPTRIYPQTNEAVFDRNASDVSDLTLHIEQEQGATPIIFGQSMPVRMTLLDNRTMQVMANQFGDWARFDEGVRLSTAVKYETSSLMEDDDFHQPLATEGAPVPFTPLDLSDDPDDVTISERVHEQFYRGISTIASDESKFFDSTEPWTAHAPEIRQVAAQWIRERGGTDPVAMANEIQRRLHTQFSYTLEPRVADRDFPITGFLTETHEGHCEYFASAMVLMLRTLRIPARLATGYHTREWNEAGQFYVVRESHAHVWVEMFSPTGEWLIYDPTPPTGLPPEVSLTSWMRFMHWLDAHRHTWYRWVIDLDQGEQVQIWNRLGLPLQRWQQQLVLGLQNLTHTGRVAARQLSALLYAVIVMVLGAVILLGAILLGRKSARTQRAAKHRVRRDMALYYHQMIKWLKRKGHVRRAGVTPAEFAKALHASHPHLAGVAEVTEIYYRERYAGDELPEKERARARQLVVSLINPAG